jgi:YVTN family beta-propeller protein
MPYGVAISPDGNKVYITNQGDNTVSVISSVTNSVIAKITVGNEPYGLSVSPNGNRLYVANGSPCCSGIISVINTATDTVMVTIPVGNSPCGVSVTPDGSKVYVADYYSNNVSVINTVTNTVIVGIPVGNNPVAFGNFISPRFDIIDTNCSAKYAISATTTPHLYYVTDSIIGIPPVKYLWSWGDGTYDTIAYPTHNYDTARTYTICLTITDSTGCTNTYCDTSYLQRSSNSIITVEVIPQIITGINEKELSNKIKCYPNPTSNTITLEAPQDAIIEITNIQGQLVKTYNATGNKTSIDVSAFPSGVYVVEVKSEKVYNVGKFVKE